MNRDWKKIIAWVLYGFAETPVSALYITFFWPLYIKELLGGNEFQIGLAMGFSLLFIALTVPLLGAISDAWGRRMPFLIISTLLTTFTVVLTGYVGLFGALILGFLTRYFLVVDTDLYDAKLVDIAPPHQIGFISGLGVGVSTLGTLAALAIAYPILQMLGWGSISAIRAMFWEGLFFLIIFSLPLFAWVPDPPTVNHRTMRVNEILRKAVAEIGATLSKFRKFTALPRFLLASFIYNDAVATALIFLVLYARQVIGVTLQQFFFAYALMAAGATLGALLFGRISDRIGPQRALSLALMGWIGVVIYLLITATFRDLVIGGFIAGAMFGGIWTMNRHMLTRITPYHKLGEIFGIEGFTERLSGVIGPIAFGALVVSFGYTPALLFILFISFIGLLLLQLVPSSPTTNL